MGRFAHALARPGLTAIAEVKRRSPSAGELRPDADPARIAAGYERAGAAAVSILVDERFGGTWDDLRAARAAAALPLLAKGFFTTDEDLRTARDAGADAALLLLRDLDDATARRLLDEAFALGLETLVEAHGADELERAVALGSPVIGINMGPSSQVVSARLLPWRPLLPRLAGWHRAPEVSPGPGGALIT